MQNTKPTVGIFSEPNFLSVNILESLLSKKCSVKIFTDNVKIWRTKTLHLSSSNDLAILPLNTKPKDFKNLDYCLFLSGFINEAPRPDGLGIFSRASSGAESLRSENTSLIHRLTSGFFAKGDKANIYEDVETFAKYNLPISAKKILIFPIEKFISDKNFKIKTNDNLAIIYVGDLLGPRIDLESNLLVPSLLNEVQDNLTFTVSVGEVFYPVFAPDVAKLITKWLFSFGPYGRETFILGEEITYGALFNEILKFSSNCKLIYNTDGIPRIVPRGFDIKRLPCNLNFALSETVGYMYRAAQIDKNATSFKTPKRKFHLSQKAKYWIGGISFGFLILFSPFIIIAFSVGLIGLSYRNFISQKSSNIQNTLLLAKSFAVIGRSESSVLKYIPILGNVYKESYFAGSLSSQASSIAMEVAPLATDASDLFTRVMGQDIYDPKIYVAQMLPSFDNIYQNLSFLQADTKLEAGSGTILAKAILQKVDFERLKLLATQGKIIIANLPQDLGSEGSKRYLVLFQNNMELRPTGGFIGSFGIITFEGGRMADFSVSDVYSADGQLKGHVEPPAPIKSYLGEANWFLRDSNWDPDFATSAQRAEWFLGKEIYQNVDGVIGIDLDLVRKILKITGSVFLPDYNLDITDANLYEKTQAEAEQSFFPGSSQKASFLTALSRNLLAEIGKITPQEKFEVLKNIIAELDERHIQLFVHNDQTQSALSALNYSGEVIMPDCGDGCYADMTGIVEANVGVNKANYFITRQEDLSVEIDGNSIKRTLTLTLANSASNVLGNSGKYKAYIRFLTPADAKVDNFSVVSGTEANQIQPEIYNIKNRREVGGLTEILPGQTKKIILTYESPGFASYQVTGNYKLFIRKQAGVDGYPISLTINGVNVYNSTLAKDIWIQKF